GGPVDGDDPVAYADVGRGGGGGDTVASLDDVGDHRDRLADAGGDDGPEEHDEGHEEVHPDAGEDHHRLLPERLLPVGAADVLGGHLLEGVHPDDADVPAGGDRLDAVFGLPPLDRPQLRPEPEEELGGFHAGGFGSEEVAGLVCHHEQGDGDDGDEASDHGHNLLTKTI